MVVHINNENVTKNASSQMTLQGHGTSPTFVLLVEDKIKMIFQTKTLERDYVFENDYLFLFVLL